MFTFLSSVLCPALAACLPPRPQTESHTQTLPFETETAIWLLRVLENCMACTSTESSSLIMSTSVWFSCCQTSRHLYGRMTWRAPPCVWDSWNRNETDRECPYVTSSTHMHNFDVLTSTRQDKMKVSASLDENDLDILYFSKHTFL